MSSLRSARTITISIAAPAADVYAFIMDVTRLPAWARGLGEAPSAIGDGSWRIETPVGPMRLTFVAHNVLGVADHVVEPLDGSGPTVDVPLRVVPNGPAGSEVMFTLFRQPGMSEQQFAADAELVRGDLQRLKQLVEGAQPR